MAEKAKLAIIQKKGQLTIPIEIRRKWHMEEGGVVALIEDETGLRISPREALVMGALDRLGAVLQEKGITLEELIESGREIRGEIYTRLLHLEN